MAERVVKVTLTAQVSAYLEGMDQVAKKTRENRSEAKKLAAQLDAQRKAFNFVGKSMLAAGGVVAAGLALAVAKAAEFDQAMSNVEAATHESASNMALLRDAAIKAGAETVFSAKESAGAIEELAKAGLSTRDILGGGLKGALDLAAAGGMDVANAAAVASTTLQQFGLNGSKAQHVADLLAAGAGKAMGDVSDLSQALSQSGTVAAQFGMSLDETVGTLAAFASKGLLGSDAGTSFRTMLLRLANPTGEAAAKMKELGIAAYDANGSFVGTAALAGQLQKGLKGLTQEQRNAALAVIFGQDAIRSANILYTEGAKGIAEWTRKVDDSGYAGETAAKRLDNLKGDLEQLSGAFDSAMISIGEGGQGPLRFLVQTLSGVVDKFNELPAGGKETVFWIGAVAAAVTAAGGATLVAIPKIAAYRAAVTDLGPTAEKTSRLVGVAMKGIGTVAAVTTAIALLDQLNRQLNGTGVSVTELANTISKGSVGDALKQSLEGSGNWFQNTAGVLKEAEDGFEDLGKALDHVANSMDTRWAGAMSTYVDWIDGSTEPTDNYRDALDKLGETLASLPTEDASAALRQLRDTYNLTDKQLTTLIDNSGGYRDAIIKQIDEDGLAANSQMILKYALGESRRATNDNADALRQLEGRAGSTKDEIEGLEDTIRNFGKAQFDVNAATRDFEQAIDDASQALVDNGTTLDVGTQKGRDNQRVLDEIAKSTLNLSASIQGQTQDSDQATAAIQRGRDALIDQAIKFGMTRAQAEEYANKLGLIPANVNTSVNLNTAKAEQVLASFKSRWENTPIYLRADMARVGRADATPTIGRARGGIIPGVPSRVDNTVIRAATGEFMTNSDATAKNRAALEYINNGGIIRGFAHGGEVQPRYAEATYRRFTSQPSLSTDMRWMRETMQDLANRPVYVIVDGQVLASSTNAANRR